MTNKDFIHQRDNGKFSTKFQGEHTVFVQVRHKNIHNIKKVNNNNKYNSFLSALRKKQFIDFPWSNTKFINKYFNKSYIPNKYNLPWSSLNIY